MKNARAWWRANKVIINSNMNETDTKESKNENDNNSNSNINNINNVKYFGLINTLYYINDIFIKEGPFDGILGFSQGGSLLTMLLALKHNPNYAYNTLKLDSKRFDVNLLNKNIKFSWICSTGMPRDYRIKPLLDKIVNIRESNKSDETNENKENIKDTSNIDDCKRIQTPTMFVIGTTDKIVSHERAIKLCDVFDKECLTLVEHDGGHFIPTHTEVTQQYRQFVEPFLDDGSKL